MTNKTAIEIFDEGDHGYGQYYFEDVSDIRQALQANTSGWMDIDHENIYHPFEKNILCADSAGDIFIAYQDVTGWYLTQSGKRILDLPTHWQPLPTPPTEGGE